MHHTLLGQPTTYVDSYAPGLLQALPRDTVHLVGADQWTAYEISWLEARGKPQARIGTFVFPAQSPRLIESKSFKLYLGSLHHTVFAGESAVVDTLIRDLSAACGAPVEVSLQPYVPAPPPSGICLDDIDTTVEHYQPHAEYLQAGADLVEETLYSHLLKSNCPVTGQPDWATLLVRYRGPQIDRAALLRYIVSYRKHSGFHEQCVEQIFTALLARCLPQALYVEARYTRRGGLEINPWRSTHANFRVAPWRSPRQ